MSEGTKVVSLADAMARIDVLEMQMSAVQVALAGAMFDIDFIKESIANPSATQVAEAA